ncbi:MAG: S46 family peptidase [Rikenellaceae bacterium]
MKKFFLSLAAVMTLAFSAKADEGMWLLPFLKKLNIADMQAKGLKLSAEDIYSANQTSLKDAIAIFGGGCTSEVISSQGLLLTNHHCGYGAIQSHSSVEHDYLRDGFWSNSFEEEIPTPGLSATFVKKIVDVTDQIIPQLSNSMTEKERSEKVAELTAKITKENATDAPGCYVMVRDYFGGNQYLLFEMQRYDDVRMVGAPPTSIGKFGGDTDNWMWPRHTGDFSIFRIYTDKDGNPAKYSADNIPMQAKRHLPISLKGVKEGDFSMVIGFPGSTSRYMTSAEVSETLTQNNPIRIKVRGERQEVLMADMKASQKINIQYASKYAGSSNYWKNAIGMNQGIEKLDVVGEKAAIEKRFTEWVEAGGAERKAEYGEAIELIHKAVEGRMPYNYTNSYLMESLLSGIELTRMASTFQPLAVELDKKERGLENDVEGALEAAKKSAEAFYKNYSPSTDRKAAKVMVKLFMSDVTPINRPTVFAAIEKIGADKAVDELYDNSIFENEAKLNSFLASPSSKTLANDPFMAFARSVSEVYKANGEKAKEYNEMFARGHRLFIKGYMEMDKDAKTFYPDANFTMRLTYGNVLPYLDYNYTTFLSEVLQKEDPNNAYEFTVHPKLKELYKKKNFGKYGKKDVVVAFISNNDITGGNSGSPVINGNGELIGTAFDGNWEAMSGDIAFEPSLQRCISVDIRYTLFIIDKFAGCTRLIDEMTIVK